MSFNESESSAIERNPWVDEDSRAIENVMLLCQKTGHVTHTLVSPDSDDWTGQSHTDSE